VNRFEGFTPGPWEVDEAGTYVYASRGGDECGLPFVANCEDSIISPTATCKANARLIASAPAMRAELDTLQSRYRHVVEVLRKNGFWAALLTDAEIDAQVDEDIASRSCRMCGGARVMDVGHGAATELVPCRHCNPEGVMP